MLKYMMIAAGALMLSAGPALSVERPADRQMTEDEGEDEDSRTQQPMRQVTGRVLQQKEVAERAADTKNLVVLLETQGGRRVVVDLGPRQDIEDIEVETLADAGPLTAEGRLVRVGRRYVLLAENLRIGDRQWDIKRAERTKQREVRGNVVATKQVDVVGHPSPHLVALVEVADNDRRIVDLGRYRDVRQKIRQGGELTATGRFVRVGEHSVLVAREAMFDGQQVEVVRPQPMRARRSQQQDQAQQPDQAQGRDQAQRKDQPQQQDRAQSPDAAQQPQDRPDQPQAERQEQQQPQG